MSDITYNNTQDDPWYQAREYMGARDSAYPALKLQLDMIYHDIKNGTLSQDGQFFQAITEVKNKYPKPE